jgi:hypothetical protein
MYITFANLPEIFFYLLEERADSDKSVLNVPELQRSRNIKRGWIKQFGASAHKFLIGFFWIDLLGQS